MGLLAAVNQGRTIGDWKPGTIPLGFFERRYGARADGLQPPVPESMREAVLARLDGWRRHKTRHGKKNMVSRLREGCDFAEACFELHATEMLDPAHVLADRLLYDLLSVG